MSETKIEDTLHVLEEGKTLGGEVEVDTTRILQFTIQFKIALLRDLDPQ